MVLTTAPTNAASQLSPASAFNREWFPEGTRPKGVPDLTGGMVRETQDYTATGSRGQDCRRPVERKERALLKSSCEALRCHCCRSGEMGRKRRPQGSRPFRDRPSL